MNAGSATITDSTISNNTSSGQGGGIYHNGDTMTITDSMVVDNTAADVGGGILVNSTMVISGSEIKENDALHGAGEAALRGERDC